MTKKGIRSKTLLLYMNFLVPLALSGGFYEYSTVISGILMGIFIFVFLNSRKNIYVWDRKLWKQTAVPFLVPVCFLAVSIWSVDRFTALVGFWHFAPAMLWSWLVFQMDQEEKRDLIGIVPLAGAAMVAVSVLALVSEHTAHFLWQAGRLGGTFQYSNTCALFLLLGLSVTAQTRGDRRRFVVAAILLAGILLTGSRSVLILTIVWAMAKTFTHKELRRPTLYLGIGAVICGCFYVLVTGSFQNMGRILTLFTNHSTILGRLLYLKDGARLVLRFPFGMGWQGYYYVQPMYQHGVYTTRYVHNDYMQIALDLGVIPAVIVIGYLVWQLMKGRQARERKELMILLMAAAFTDFHMQFLWMIMLGILCLDLGREDTDKALRHMGRTQRMESGIIVGCAILFLSYGLVPFTARRLHDNERVLQFFPHYTEVETELMNAAESPEEAENYAKDIIAHNPYAKSAYRHLGVISYMRGDLSGMVEYLDHAVEVGRYDVELYGLYEDLLEKAMRSPKLRQEEYQSLEKAWEDLQKRRDQVKETTDPIAYLLRDKPAFE